MNTAHKMCNLANVVGLHEAVDLYRGSVIKDAAHNFDEDGFGIIFFEDKSIAMLLGDNGDSRGVVLADGLVAFASLEVLLMATADDLGRQSSLPPSRIDLLRRSVAYVRATAFEKIVSIMEEEGDAA